MRRKQCDYCTKIIPMAGGGKTNHMFMHEKEGLVTARATRDRYVFPETPKGKKVKAGLKRAARVAAKAHEKGGVK